MSLSAIILDLIPASGCTLLALRSALRRDHPHFAAHVIDHVLVGLRAVNKIRVLGGTVSVIGKLIDTPKVKVERTPEQIAIQREATQRWALANQQKIQAQRAKQAAERRASVPRGNYTAERLRQIEGEAS